MTSSEAARDSIGVSSREPPGLLPAGTKGTAATGQAGGRGGGGTSFSTPGATALETQAGRVPRSGQGVGASDSELSSGPRPQTTTPSSLAPPRTVAPPRGGALPSSPPQSRGGPESEEEEGDEDNERRAADDAEEEGEADQQDGPCCRSSLSSSRWGAGGGAGGGGYGRGPAAWDRVRVDGGSGGGGGCRDGGDGRRDSELRGAAARTSAVSKWRSAAWGVGRPRPRTIGSGCGDGAVLTRPALGTGPRACQWPASFRPQASACLPEGLPG